MFSIIIILQDAVFTGNHYYIPEPVIHEYSFETYTIYVAPATGLGERYALIVTDHLCMIGQANIDPWAWVSDRHVCH